MDMATSPANPLTVDLARKRCRPSDCGSVRVLTRKLSRIFEWKSRKNPSKAARRSTGDAARRRTKGFPAPVTSLLLGQLHLPHPGPPPYPAVGPREESRLLPRRPREMPVSVLPSPAYVPSMAVPCCSGGVAGFHPGVGRGGWCS